MRQVTIDVEGRFIDNISNEVKDATSSLNKLETEAKDAQKEVDNIGKKKVKPVIDADTDRFTQKLRDADSKLDKLKKSTSNSVLLKLKDQATEKLKNAIGVAKNWNGKTYEALLKVRDSQALSALKKVSGYAGTLSGKTWTTMVKIKDLATSPLRGIKNMLFSIQSLVMAITAGLAAKQLILNPINVADAYSSAKISFSTLLGESQGQQMMNDLDAFAKMTPFDTTGVISNAQKMLAMGWNPEDIIKDMEILGNAAASTGKLNQGLESIVRAMSQIKTKGKLSTEELNQLAEAGIAAKAMLAEQMGYGTGDTGIAKMTKDLEDGKIASDKAIAALLAGMQKYDGMMESMANETVEGLGSQIADAFNINIVRRWGQGLQDGAKRGFGSIVDLLDKAEGALEEFGDTVYELGKTFSNWAADKFENSIARILEITDSYDFQNASLGEKISMLWNGVIVDPLKEWWDNGGQQKTAETAGEIGEWMGKTITSGLLALFGVTDVFADSNFGENGGMSVAQSFVKGFTDNFDGTAIKDAFVDAVSDIWGALPWWAKALIGGTAAGKLAGGVSSLAGGVIDAVSTTKNVVGSANAMTGILGFGANAAINLGAGNLAGGASLGAGALSALGLGATAGGIAAGVAGIKALSDIGKAVQIRSQGGDRYESAAYMANGLTTGGGVLAGAMAGAALGSVVPGLGTAVGGLIGAGVGGIGGWFAGNKWATSIREAKYEVEGTAEAIADAATAEEKLAALNEAAWENMKRHMGDVKLSASEIERLADQIVWGDDISYFDTYSTAAKTAEASLNSLNTAAQNTNRWMWEAGLGVKFNEDEIESLASTIDEYITAAESLVENKHYEFTAAVSLLIDAESDGGKGILESGNTFFTGLQEQIGSLGTDLSGKVKIALEDGVITLNEQAEITSLQNQIASITEKLANAETKAELELVKLKFGGGKLDQDSFDSFMAQMETTLNERVTANDDAFKVSVSALQLQLADGAITDEQYSEQLKTLMDGYTGTVDNLKAEILGVELDIIGDSYGMELGKDAKGKLQSALENSIASGIDPINWTPEQARTFLGVDKLADDAAVAIGDMLGGVAAQLEITTVDAKLLCNYEIVNDPATEVVNAVNEAIPESMDDTITAKITGEKAIQNTITLNKSDFGIQDSYDFETTINLTTRLGAIGAINANLNNGNDGSGYRGGVFGGTSAMEQFARGGSTDNGGIVGGSTRFIRVNEESPEMIIPLSSQRRERATDLWMKTGELLNIPGFARGGIVGGNSEGFQINSYDGGDNAAGQTVMVEVGGITVEINVDATGTQNIAQAIKDQAEEIAETVAGILADAFEEQFENTPVRGGAA